MIKRSPTLWTLVSTKTKCIKLIFIGKITRVPVAFLMALSIIVVFMFCVCHTLRRGHYSFSHVGTFSSLSGLTRTNQRIKYLAQRHNTVLPVSLELATHRSYV